MMNLKITGAAVCLALVLAMLASACTKTQPTAPTTAKPTTAAPATSTAAPEGPAGELRIAASTFDQDRWDPITLSRTTIMLFIAPTFDHLIRTDAGKLLPGVADKWQMAPDGNSWTFSIHKGIKFQDGEDLKADDVKFSLDRYIRPEAFQPMLKESIDRVETVDEYTVRVRTKSADPYFPTFVSYFSPAYGAVQPKDYIEKNGDKYFAANPIGSGPWRRVAYVPADMARWEAVTNHWQRPPSFKGLTVFNVPEESTRIAMLKTGVVDAAGVSIDSGAPLKKAGFTVSATNANQAYVLLTGAVIPQGKGMPTYDVRVRQALSLAINRAELAEFYTGGSATKPLPAYLPRDAADDVDIPYWEDLAAKTYARYNLDEAKKLLADAGYAQGFNIKLWDNNMGGGIDLPRIAEIVQGYWGKIGVKATLVPSEWGTLRNIANVLKTPDTPLIGNAFMMRVGGRPAMHQVWNSHIHTKGTVSILGKSWAEVDDVLAKIGSELDAKKRADLISSTIRKVSDEWVALPLGGMPSLAAVSPRLEYAIPYGADELTVFADRAKAKR